MTHRNMMVSMIVSMTLIGIIDWSSLANADFMDFIEMHQDEPIGLKNGTSVTLSPDGKYVYTASEYDGTIGVFNRNTATGALTLVEVQRNGVNGVDGIGTAWSVTVSPDGKHVYAAGYNNRAVAVFSRDEATGKLTFVERQKDGENDVDGLYLASSVTVSPDGKHVYATGDFYDNAVAVFSRDEATGKLTFVEVQKDGQNGVDGLNGAMYVTVSPDGAHVYIASRSDSAVAVFSRNAGTGALTFVEMQKNWQNGVDGLRGAYSVMVSRDGAHVYIAGYFDDAVAVFSRNPATGKLSFVEVQQNGYSAWTGWMAPILSRPVLMTDMSMSLAITIMPWQCLVVIPRPAG